MGPRPVEFPAAKWGNLRNSRCEPLKRHLFHGGTLVAPSKLSTLSMFLTLSNEGCGSSEGEKHAGSPGCGLSERTRNSIVPSARSEEKEGPSKRRVGAFMIRIQRILCPTNLSPESAEALRYAVALARAYEAKLLLFHSVEAPAVVGVPAAGQVRRLLESALREHLRRTDISVVDWEAVCVEGDPVSTITREAAERCVDLIVMRSRRRPHAAALLGSTAESVSRTAPCPVLVTHPREREWAGLSTNEIDLRRILVAHDFSNDSELGVQYALTLAQEYQAELHMMHVLPPRARAGTGSGELNVTSENVFHRTAQRLQQAIPSQARLWCSIKQIIREGQPYSEILDYAEDHGVDLICMGVSGSGFGMRALFGSNVDRVLRQAPCPVLIARPLRPSGFSQSLTGE